MPSGKSVVGYGLTTEETGCDAQSSSGLLVDRVSTDSPPHHEHHSINCLELKRGTPIGPRKRPGHRHHSCACEFFYPKTLWPHKVFRVGFIGLARLNKHTQCRSELFSFRLREFSIVRVKPGKPPILHPSASNASRNSSPES